jgi:N6-adenosine-specific RNA methylase IME4
MKYGALLADPPWSFSVRSEKGMGRSPKYRVLPIETLAELPIPELAAKDSVLFLWTTDPLLPRALELVEAWGFTYKTVAFTWAKLNPSGEGFHIGCGYWTRANAEMCLLATRGSPRRLNADVRRLIVAPRREHSRKPDEARKGIERLVAGPYLEIFARESTPGWDVMGDQLEIFGAGAVPRRETA